MPEVKRADPVQGLKRFEIGSSRNARDGMGNLARRCHFAGNTTHHQSKHYNMLDAVGRRRRARDPNGRGQSGRKEQSLQALMGKKRRGYTLEMSRNGILCKSSGDKLIAHSAVRIYTSDNCGGSRRVIS